MATLLSVELGILQRYGRHKAKTMRPCYWRVGRN